MSVRLSRLTGCVLALIFTVVAVSGCVMDTAKLTVANGSSAVTVTKNDTTGITAISVAPGTTLDIFRQEVTAEAGYSYKIFNFSNSEVTDNSAIITGGYQFTLYKDGNTEPDKVIIISADTSEPEEVSYKFCPPPEPNYTVRDGSTLIIVIIDNDTGTTSIKAAEGTTTGLFKQEVTAKEGYFYKIYNTSGSEITNDNSLLADGDRFVLYKDNEAEPSENFIINIISQDMYYQRTSGYSIKYYSSVVSLRKGAGNSFYMKVAPGTSIIVFKREVNAEQGYYYRIFDPSGNQITDYSTIITDGCSFKFYKTGETEPEETDIISVQ